MDECFYCSMYVYICYIWNIDRKVQVFIKFHCLSGILHINKN